MKQCLFCSQEISGRNKFCSRSCSASYNNQKHPKRNPEGKCKWCRSEISASLKYCNRECRTQAKLQKAKDNRKNRSDSVVSWRQRMKLRAIEYKGSKCQRCGYDRCVNALDFHHVNPEEKEFQISKDIHSWERMKSELDKCVLLCSNCHRELHGGIWKIEDFVYPVLSIGRKTDSDSVNRGSNP